MSQSKADGRDTWWAGPADKGLGKSMTVLLLWYEYAHCLFCHHRRVTKQHYQEQKGWAREVMAPSLQPLHGKVSLPCSLSCCPGWRPTTPHLPCPQAAPSTAHTAATSLRAWQGAGPSPRQPGWGQGHGKGRVRLGRHCGAQHSSLFPQERMVTPWSLDGVLSVDFGWFCISRRDGAVESCPGPCIPLPLQRGGFLVSGVQDDLARTGKTNSNCYQVPSQIGRYAIGCICCHMENILQVEQILKIVPICCREQSSGNSCCREIWKQKMIKEVPQKK